MKLQWGFGAIFTDHRRRRLIFFFLLPVLLMVILMGPVRDLQEETPDNTAMQMVMAHYQEDTGAGNAVAAVYLNYRLFDTLFESLLLVISVTGIIYFLEEKGREKRNDAS